MDFSQQLESARFALKPHLETVQSVVEPYWERVQPFLLKVLAVPLGVWKKLSWKKRGLYILLAVVAYDILSVVTAKSSRQVVVERATVDLKSINASWTGQHPELCEEPGNVVTDASHPHAHICKCTDPTQALASDRGEVWNQHHQRMVQDAQWAGHKNKTLDVVLLGDSLMEHWNGTHRWGTTKQPESRKLFESLFTKKGGGKLEGLALGSSADTAPNLLWHLQNGILQQANLQPKVWVILVGTNDLVGTRCSQNVTVQGIVAVADFISQQRPQSAILIHGLLPRGEGGRKKAFVLGQEWHRIQGVNRALRRETTKNRTQWHYWDTGTFFLNSDRTQLHSRLISDGIHPRISGMKLWGPKLVEAIQEVLGTMRQQ